MRYLKVNILFILAIVFISPLCAQKHLQIYNVFEEYGRQAGSVLVELSTDVLSKNSKITHYKSLVVKENNGMEQAITDVIREDNKEGAILMESKKSGRVATGYYVLKQKDRNKGYEYILYKNKSKKITLIYIRGNFPPGQLETELDKLKDLFIYVNNKRIKIQ